MVRTSVIVPYNVLFHRETKNETKRILSATFSPYNRNETLTDRCRGMYYRSSFSRPTALRDRSRTRKKRLRKIRTTKDSRRESGRNDFAAVFRPQSITCRGGHDDLQLYLSAGTNGKRPRVRALVRESNIFEITDGIDILKYHLPPNINVQNISP